MRERSRCGEGLRKSWSFVGLIAAGPHVVLMVLAVLSWAEGAFGSPPDRCGASGIGLMLVGAPWSLAALDAPPVIGELMVVGGALLNMTLLYQWGRLVHSVWPAARWR